MRKRPVSYVLSQEADKDLEDIFDYTLKNFGLDQAVAYVSAFEEVFTNLAHNPELGKARPEIRMELRSFTKQSHVVFYRILKSSIRIVRVLHASRDVVSILHPGK